ncbi:BREX system P-loop protein BrxC [Vibrio parahaemolyticus]|nr:BREX system P-loop protein BrxC [Vibrio parahaemolyticus]EII2405673.1 BREX system P-loop protein BrxC [Vibrio parahaemolyticus]
MMLRDIFHNDPLKKQLANNGVATVNDDTSIESYKTLAYELETFVCTGHYQKGLQSILDAFLRNIESQDEQPGVWISGFYGSGKSHLAKMLRTLWTNNEIESGKAARAYTDLPAPITQAFETLDQLAATRGGLHAASGTLGSGTSNVRLTLLSLIFKSAGLPEQYHLAQFVMWLKSKGIYEQVRSFVEEADGSTNAWREELKDFYISELIAEALAQHLPGNKSIDDISELLLAQFPEKHEVSLDEMVSAIVDALARDGEMPLTLIVLDELQQFLAQDYDRRVYEVQEIVEKCCKAGELKSKLLFVATGQSALNSNALLMKLLGRFQIQVQLADTDVDEVIRKVILLKKESAKADVKALVEQEDSEISRHLRGTKVEHRRDDEATMVADYPLLPVRRRFWEEVLPALDRTGTGSQLRNQLRIVHEALRQTADQPLGYVVPADFIYQQIATSLLQSGVISKDIHETIGRKMAGNEEQKLQARLLSLILLIGKLPEEKQLGIYATEATLADLLLENLTTGKSELRVLVPKMLKVLEDEHEIMARDIDKAGTVYSLQTVESQAWYDEFKRQENDLLGNPQTLEAFRSKEIQSYIRKQVLQARITQGNVAEPRPITPYFDAELPAESHQRLSVWAPELSEREFDAVSRGADPDSATIFVYVPNINRSELQRAIVELKAAETTLDVRGRASTDAGKDARLSMETRMRSAESTKARLLKEIFESIQVRLAGGQEVEGDTLAEQIQNAGELACQRLYHKFKVADDRGWAKVYEQASRLADPNALEKVGYSGEADKHPVCTEVQRYIGTMKLGKDIRDHFKQAPYGWGNDVIDGALYAMLAAGVLKASDSQERAIDAKSLDRSAVTQTKFRPENVTLSKVQMIKVRGIVSSLLEESCNAGEEAAKLPLAIQNAKQVANRAGGNAPLPMAPSSALLSELEMYSGNEQLQKAFDNKDKLLSDFETWKDQAHKAELRIKQWRKLEEAMEYCRDLSIYAELAKEKDAIFTNRSLLDEPCPVKPLLDKAVNELRTAITAHREKYEEEYRQCMSDLLDDENWQRLDEAKREAFLNKRNLGTIPSVNTSDADSVFNALDEISFNQWNDKTAALPGIFSQVLRDAITELQPKTVHHKLNKPIIKSEQDLQNWLAYAEQELRTQLEKGPVVPS